jgi:carbon storage regulator
MLVIRRRAHESLLIGDGVEIEILEIEASQVKLGIRAPREVRVLRREIADTERANRAANQPAPRETLDRLASRIVSKPIPEPR